MDLQPKPALGAAAACNNSAQAEAVLGQVFQNMTRSESGRFIDAAEKVAWTVGKRHAPKGAAGPRVLERTAVALPVVQANQAVRAGWHRRRLGIQQFVNILA